VRTHKDLGAIGKGKGKGWGGWKSWLYFSFWNFRAKSQGSRIKLWQTLKN